MRASQDLSQVFLPCVFYSRLKELPIVQVLQGPKVVPQVLDRLHMILLLCCKDGVKGLQLDGKKQRIETEVNLSAFVTLCECVLNIIYHAGLHLKALASS